MAAKSKKVLVVGSSSGCGLEVTKLLTGSGDFEVHALVRDADRASQALGSTAQKAKLIVGDVTKKETLEPACQGMDAVVCTIGARSGWKFPTTSAKDTPKYVDYMGVKNLSEAAASSKVPTFVLVSSMFVTRPFSPLAIILNTIKGRVLAWKLKGELSLKDAYAKDKDAGAYYIIRPGGLNNKEAGQLKIIAEQGDKGLGYISRKDVALVVEACLQGICPQKNVTFEVTTDKSLPQTNLEEVLANLKSD